MNSEFLTRKDLAQRWRCTPQHISNLVVQEKIPAPIPISNRVHIWKSVDIERYEKDAQRKSKETLQPDLKI